MLVMHMHMHKLWPAIMWLSPLNKRLKKVYADIQTDFLPNMSWRTSSYIVKIKFNKTWLLR